MDITIMEIIVLAMASFRLTRLLVYDKITEFIRNPFFEEIEELDEQGKPEVYLIPKKAGIKGFFGQLLSCYWCSGIWSSIFLYLLYFFFPQAALPVLLVLAVAGIAGIIETLVMRWLDE